MFDEYRPTLTTLAVAVAVVAALAIPAAALGSTASQDPAATTTADVATPTATPTATPRNGTATITFEDQQASSTVTVQAVSLSEGGFVAIYNSSGALVGVTDYLEPGEYENVEIDVSPAFEMSGVAIAEVHYDNGDNSFNATEDPGYQAAGSIVSDTAFVSPDGFSRSTATETPTPTATDSPTEAVTDTQTATETETETTGASSPGFTAVLAVVALVAGALIVRRD